jgi:uncharacterized cupredoxin-like copper-binding protein
MSLFPWITSTLIGVSLAAGAAAAAEGPPGHSHSHGQFSAGEPGSPKRASRVIQVTMREANGKMIYVPDRIEVRRGEQIRFVLRNAGVIEHEFVLATTEENLKHAEEMKKFPEMEHDDPNARRLAPSRSEDLVWHFTKVGEFEFGCLIPGHREAGMIGKVIVK